MLYFILQFANRVYYHAEEITSILTCMVFLNVNWADKIAGGFITLGMSLLTAGLVSLAKRFNLTDKIIELIKVTYNKYKNDKENRDS